MSHTHIADSLPGWNFQNFLVAEETPELASSFA